MAHVADISADALPRIYPLADALLLAQLPCGVVAADNEGHVTLVNTVAAALWPALAAVTGPQPLLPPVRGWHVTGECLLSRALRGEEPPALEILADAAGAGDAPAMRVVATALRDAYGHIAGAVAVCTVVTGTTGTVIASDKAAASGRTNRELVRSNNELEHFASVASHDLQEPLRKILAFGDRLQQSDGPTLSQPGQDSLGRVLAAARRMQVLINGLLAFARITSAARPFVPVDLAAVAAEVLGDLETQMARGGGHVEVGALPTIEADPLQMRQLLQNLMSNALKFQRPNCSAEVTITAEPVGAPAGAAEAAGPWYRLTVRDNGIGFEQQYAERIFRVFERLNGRTDYEGTGIGLALCQKIVERHGGAIRAESTPDQGAAFLIILPAHQTEADNR